MLFKTHTVALALLTSLIASAIPTPHPSIFQAQAAESQFVQGMAEEEVTELVMLPQTQQVLIGQGNGQLSLMALESQRLLKTVSLTSSGIVKIFPLASRIWVVFRDRQIWQLDAQLKPLKKYKLPGEYPLLSAVHFENQLLLGDLNGISELDLNTGKAKPFTVGKQPFSHRLALSPQGVLATSLKNGQIALIDLKRRQVLHTLPGHPIGYEVDIIKVMTFNPSGQWLLTAGEDYHQKVWDVKNAKLLADVNVGSFITHQAFYSDTDFVAADIDNNLYLAKAPGIDGDILENQFLGWPASLSLNPDKTQVWLGLSSKFDEGQTYLQIFQLQELQAQAAQEAQAYAENQRLEALFEMVSTGNLEALKEQLATGTDINTRNEEGQTLLNASIAASQLQIANYLIAAGASLTGEQPETPTALGTALSHNHQQLIDSLIVQNALGSPQQQVNYLPDAIHHHNFQAVKALIAAGVSPEQARDDGATPVMSALEEGQIEILEYLLSKGARLDTVPPNKSTLLMLASKNINSLNWFWQRQLPFEINAQDEGANTALHYAVENISLDPLAPALAHFEALLQRGANVNLINYEDKPPALILFSQKAEAGSLLKVIELFRKYGARLDLSDNMKQGIAHYLAQAETADYLLQFADYPLDWGQQDFQGKTPAILAVEQAQKALGAGADEEVLTTLQAKFSILLKKELNLKAQQEESGYNILHEFLYLLQKMDMAELDKDLEKQLLALWQSLLEQGADPYQKNSSDQNTFEQLAELSEQYSYLFSDNQSARLQSILNKYSQPAH